MVSNKFIVTLSLIAITVLDARRPLHIKDSEFDRHPLVSTDNNVNHAMGTRHSPLV